jgi:hypothetical protein
VGTDQSSASHVAPSCRNFDNYSDRDLTVFDEGLKEHDVTNDVDTCMSVTSPEAENYIGEDVAIET